MSIRLKKLPAFSVVTQELGRQECPLYLRYDIARIIWNVYKLSDYSGFPIQPHKEQLDQAAFRRIERQLIESSIIRSVSGLPDQSAYLLLGANEKDASVLSCAVDPFCYISHLSAMEFHGLTDRLPEKLYLSSPPPKAWKSFAIERMQRDLGDDYEAFAAARLPLLARIRLEKIAGRQVHRYTSSHRGAFKILKSPNIRIATIGRTFLDMLHEPDMCGGLAHVLETFKSNAGRHLNLIVDELDQHGGEIDKVRAGFILEQLCGCQSPRIDAWVQYAKRGGSRKLDPATDYSSEYSERWCLSINTVLPE